MSASDTLADLLSVKEHFRLIDKRAGGGWLTQRDALHEQINAIQRERFRTQGASEGAPWPKQQPGWARLKDAKGVPVIPLRWIGGKDRLYKSLTTKSSADHYFRASNDGVEVGTALPYADRHDSGTGKNPLGELIPKRPLSALGDESREDIAAHLLAFIATGESL